MRAKNFLLKPLLTRASRGWNWERWNLLRWKNSLRPIRPYTQLIFRRISTVCTKWDFVFQQTSFVYKQRVLRRNIIGGEWWGGKIISVWLGVSIFSMGNTGNVFLPNKEIWKFLFPPWIVKVWSDVLKM